MSKDSFANPGNFAVEFFQIKRSEIKKREIILFNFIAG